MAFAYSFSCAKRNSEVCSKSNGEPGAALTNGTNDKPQFPVITVVTPCDTLANIRGSRRTMASSWVCTSMKPGATVKPLTSQISSASNVKFSPMATMRSPCTHRSAGRAGAPLPSTNCVLRNKSVFMLAYPSRHWTKPSPPLGVGPHLARGPVRPI